MPRQIAYTSLDLRQVDPTLIRPSGGSDPSAAVAWAELETATQGFIKSQQLESAIASLFLDIPLTGGITESRPALEGAGSYFFTRFELDLVALGGATWATRRISDDALLDSQGNRQEALYNFKITGEGACAIEFQSTLEPAVSDGQYTLVIQRRPTPISGSTILPKNSPFAFANGSTFFYGANGTYTPTSSTGETWDTWQTNELKVNPSQGFVITGLDEVTGLNDGLYYRYSLTPTFLTAPAEITKAEYDAF
jgi:hypothetical protein